MAKKNQATPEKGKTTPQRSYRFNDDDLNRMAVLKAVWGNETFKPNETDVIRRALRLTVDRLTEDEKSRLAEDEIEKYQKIL